MKLCWGSDFFNVGNAYGYSIHNRMMREHVGQIAEITDDAPVALTICSGDKFRPVPGKKNFLFTMFETPEIPQSYIDNLPLADHIVVPCQWLKIVFAKYTDRPISWCWEGVDPEKFAFIERQAPRGGSRFRYLWVGAPNPRKGYQVVTQFAKVVEKIAHVELYLKTTTPKKTPNEEIRKWARENWKSLIERYGPDDAEAQLQVMLKREDIAGKIHVQGRYQNIIVDTRDIAFEELIGLYHSAHCFLLPTLGEGFGLTLCEAMATGLPCVATSVTGTKDFFDSEVGYPIRYQWTARRLEQYDLNTHVAMPDANDFVKKAVKVFSNYPKALRKGQAGADRIRSKFIWAKAAERLVEILKNGAN